MSVNIAWNDTTNSDMQEINNLFNSFFGQVHTQFSTDEEINSHFTEMDEIFDHMFNQNPFFNQELRKDNGSPFSKGNTIEIAENSVNSSGQSMMVTISVDKNGNVKQTIKTFGLADKNPKFFPLSETFAGNGRNPAAPVLVGNYDPLENLSENNSDFRSQPVIRVINRDDTSFEEEISPILNNLFYMALSLILILFVLTGLILRKRNIMIRQAVLRHERNRQRAAAQMVGSPNQQVVRSSNGDLLISMPTKEELPKYEDVCLNRAEIEYEKTRTCSSEISEAPPKYEEK